MILVFTALIRSPSLSLTASTLLISSLISSSSAAITVVSSAYHTFDIFLPRIEIPPLQFSCVSLMIHSPYILNSCCDGMHPCRTPCSARKASDFSPSTLTTIVLSALTPPGLPNTREFQFLVRFRTILSTWRVKKLRIINETLHCRYVKEVLILVKIKKKKVKVEWQIDSV